MPYLELQDKSLHLRRYPERRDDPLLPWDAADLYLLDWIRNDEAAGPGTSLLLVNDAFGALAAALYHLGPASWSDSHLARLALERNLARNELDARGVTFVPGDRSPDGSFDLVLLKIPKSLAYLEDVLLRLRPHLHPGSRLVAGGMIKHTPARVFRLLETVIGPVRTSLGWKKARLATAVFDAARDLPARLPDATFPLEEWGWTLASGANVFSRDHLDLGTRLLLPNLPQSDLPLKMADLGCGNGILALALARSCPSAAVLGVDASYQAVASARDNIARAGLTGRDLRFEVGDGLEDVAAGSLDTVVCNPPFHQAQTVGAQPAWRMFEQAHRALKPGGELLIVGNRHLGYHVKLGRLFGNCRTLASDRKFVVLAARR